MNDPLTWKHGKDCLWEGGGMGRGGKGGKIETTEIEQQ